MLIKQKSLLVALVSGFIISAVLVLTLFGYILYIELNEREFSISYTNTLKKINAKIYSKYIEVPVLETRIETTGALKGKPIIAGEMKNTGTRSIKHILLNIRFLDKDNAAIYEIPVCPQDPALGASPLSAVPIPALNPEPVLIMPGSSISFKKVLTGCPKEIMSSLQEKTGLSKNSGRWSGRLAYDLIEVEF